MLLFLWLAQLIMPHQATQSFMAYRRGLSSRFLEINYSAKYSGLFQGERDSLSALPWIADDMTPHQAGWDVQEGTNLLPPEPDERMEHFID
jgi:hypothetical protein